MGLEDYIGRFKETEREDVKDAVTMRNLCYAVARLIYEEMISNHAVNFDGTVNDDFKLGENTFRTVSGDLSYKRTAYIGSNLLQKILYDFHKLPAWKKAYMKESISKHIMRRIIKDSDKRAVSPDMLDKIEETVNDFLKTIHKASINSYYIEDFWAGVITEDQFDRYIEKEINYDFYTEI